jgi:plastocyanin
MIHLCQPQPLKTATRLTLLFSLLLTGLLSANWLHAEPHYTKVVEVTLGDYRYMPSNIQLIVDQPVVLHLANVDSFTPHNFTLKDASDGLDVDVDIPAGESVDVYLMPLVAGSHTFYCKNKLWLMDSHREKGMEGTLTVIPALQARQQSEPLPELQPEQPTKPQAD